MIYQIAYTSAAARNITDDDFKTILASARRNNPREGLTGMLTFAGGSFLQVLEGERDAVERRYSIIRGDHRHMSAMKLVSHMVPERGFPDWSMGWYDCPPDHPINALVKKIGSAKEMSEIALQQSSPVQSLMNIFVKHRFA